MTTFGGIQLRQIFHPPLSSIHKLKIEFSFARFVECQTGVADHHEANLVKVEQSLMHRFIGSPKVTSTGKCDRFIGFDVLGMDHIRSGASHVLEIVQLEILFAAQLGNFMGRQNDHAGNRNEVSPIHLFAIYFDDVLGNRDRFLHVADDRFLDHRRK